MGLVEQLRRGVDTNEPPDKTDRVMTEAADEIEKLRAALEKEEKFTMAAMDKAKAYRAALEIMKASFDDAHVMIKELRAALERIADLYGYEAEANAVSIARKALAKEKE